MFVKYAEKSAWRGMYVYRGKPSKFYAVQLFRIVLDPGLGGCLRSKPTLSISAFKMHWVVRIPMPYVSWRYPVTPIRGALHRWSNRFWLRMDGRKRS